MNIEFDKFYRAFKEFTLSKDDKEMAEHLGIEHKEFSKCIKRKEVPMEVFLEYCGRRIIDPFWLCGV
jgi:hypothetical protein